MLLITCFLPFQKSRFFQRFSKQKVSQKRFIVENEFLSICSETRKQQNNKNDERKQTEQVFNKNGYEIGAHNTVNMIFCLERYTRCTTLNNIRT